LSGAAEAVIGQLNGSPVLNLVSCCPSLPREKHFPRFPPLPCSQIAWSRHRLPSSGTHAATPPRYHRAAAIPPNTLFPHWRHRLDLELMFSCNGDACRRALSAALPNRHGGRCRWETGLRRARNDRRDCTRIPPTSPHRSSRRNKRPLNDDPLANGRGQTSQGMERRNA
jgi:hypothetical protein